MAFTIKPGVTWVEKLDKLQRIHILLLSKPFPC